MGDTRSALLPLALALATSCGGAGGAERTEYRYAAPVETGDGWRTASVSDVGVDEARVADAVQGILDGRYRQVHGLLVVRHKRLVVEEYFAGNDRQGAYVRYERDTIHDLASVTKSITSIMTGQAIAQGLMADEQVRALSYLPEYAHLVTPEKESITIGHLLTMTSGWQWSESTEWVAANDMYQFNVQPDPLAYLIGKPMAAEPGTSWVYNGGAVTLLGKVIERASGVNLETFSERHLFAPLGISQFWWPYMRPDLIAAHGDLRLRPRDMAKIGQTMLDEGVWGETRVLPAEWVRRSRALAVPFTGGQGHDGYGYLWWLRTYWGAAGGPTSAYSAEGWGGQRIIVLPTLDAVIVFTGGNYWTSEPVDMIMESHIVPAF